MARPSSYNKAIAEEICERISLAEPLYKICKDTHMPDVSTVFRWTYKNEEFRNNLAHARETCADFLSHQIIEIADEQNEDWFETNHGKMFNKEAAARSRIRIDARLKMMQLLKPKSYSDKMQIEHDHKGAVGVQLVHSIPRPEREE